LGVINFFCPATLNVSGDGTLLSCTQGRPYATASEARLFHLPSLEAVPGRDKLPQDVSAATFHPKPEFLVTGGWGGDIRL